MTERERRFEQLREATAKRLARMTPQDRDQVMQHHLAAAISPEARFRALVRMTTAVLELRKGLQKVGEQQDD